jgi:SAM-dependent methyltransferase
LPDPSQRLDPTRRFSDRVDYYVRSRPGYPRAIIDFCRDELELKPRDSVADIGSGTGLLSELFLQNGNPVFAIEPNEAMRRAAEQNLIRYSNFYSTAATAENTTLPTSSIPFVIAGQAFHWFDPKGARGEFERILRPGGWALIIWNLRKKDSREGFSTAYDGVVKEFQNTRDEGLYQRHVSRDSQAIGAFFAPSEYRSRVFANSQSLNLDGLIDRAFSSSNLPLPGQAGADEMVERLREIFNQHSRNGVVVQPYDTQVYYERLK